MTIVDPECLDDDRRAWDCIWCGAWPDAPHDAGCQGIDEPEAGLDA